MSDADRLKETALSQVKARGLYVPDSICPQFDNMGSDDPNRTYRLGLMGGTFDPIHVGHLVCAEQARDTFNLDGVIFIPAGVPVFKKDKKVSDAQLRMEMCRLATKGNPHFGVSSIEIDRGGNTYTADTLLQLKAFFPKNVKLYFITGADAVLSIMKWRDSETISHMAYLIGVTRPGCSITDEFKAEIQRNTSFEISYLQMTDLSISSSLLRDYVSQEKSIRYLVTDNVFDYIANHGLYHNHPLGGDDR